MRRLLPPVVALATICSSAGASAQQPSGVGAALVHAEGEVYLNDRAVESISGTAGLPATAVLRTSAGRAAIALKRGGVLFVDASSSVRVLADATNNSSRIEVLTGSAIVASEAGAPIVQCENDIRLAEGGTFRFDVRPGRSSDERSCQFRVFDGAATVRLLSVSSALREGQSMICNRRCGDMIPTASFSREQIDGFDRWAKQVHRRLRM